MIHYDTVEDASAKLTSTICYYEDKAVTVKIVQGGDTPGAIMAGIVGRDWARAKYVNIKDPKFRYTKFNLGYANHGQVAVWWCRIPMKQWRQGLRADQMQRFASNAMYNDYGRWGFDKSICGMLENQYPHIDDCRKILTDKTSYNIAFHKDFGLSWDNLHQDFILEYRGKNIGTSHDLKKFNLTDEHKYLGEVVAETLKNVY